MKTQVLTILVVNFIASHAFATIIKRGVHVPTEPEIQQSTQSRGNIPAKSPYNNNPAEINQERMEENPRGSESSPLNWPQGPASKSRTGEEIED